MFQLLKHHNAGALAHDETVTIDIIGARGALRLVVEIGGKRLAGGKAGERDAADRRFRAAGNHDIGIAEADDPAGVADRMRARRAGRYDRMIGAAQLVPDRDLARGKVDQAAGNEERGNAARAAVAQRIAGFNDPFEPADSGADQHAGRDLVIVAFGMPVGIRKRHVGCRDRIGDERIDLALLLRLQPLIGIEASIAAVAKRD